MPFYSRAEFDCSSDNVAATVSGLLELLPFEPAKMSVFYSEFHKDVPDRPYDKRWLLENISTEELVGLTGTTLYGKKYRRGSGHPFVTLGFKPFDERVRIGLTCVDAISLDWMLDGDNLLQTMLCGGATLWYLYCYRRLTKPGGYNVSQKPSIAEFRRAEPWKDSAVLAPHKARFVTSPLMFFGEGVQSLIPLRRFLLSPGSTEMEICGNPVVRVELFGLDEPECESHAESKRRFWETTDLFTYLVNAEKRNPVNAIKDYERRALLYQKLKKEGRV